MDSKGLMLPMDGSTHQWFGDSKSCLIAVIDDASSKIFSEFIPSKSTLTCLKVLKKLIVKKGIFKTLCG